ncbi:MAG: apolipoprotein N-acyltransferase [Bdellovibrio sp.]|nr:apolipoprotein N-acyltransferase [Bdellovibrio sp.]
MATVELSQSTSFYKKIFFAGWLTQFILTLIGFNWIYFVASEFGQLNWILSLAALLLFAAFMHLYIPFSLVIGVWLVRKFKVYSKLSQFLIFALVLSLLERIWPSIFEWNLAYTLLWIKLPLYQWADSVGFWGLSTWILIVQAFITWALYTWKTKKSRSFITIISVLLFVAIFSIMGQLKKETWSKARDTVQFGMVQGNIGNLEKILAEKADRFHLYILGIYTDLTDQHLKQHPETELMIWPETAMPFALDTNYHRLEAQKKLLSSVTAWNLPLITGAYAIDSTKRDHLGYPLTSNSVFFLGPNEKLLAEPYSKSDLLVFGEYMPFGEQIPFLYKLLPFVGVYKRGDGPTVNDVILKNKTLKIGSQICYESLNPSFSRGLAEKGAEIIFNVTNDSWFGWWAEPYQHNIMTLARAIEVRRPLVRSTNTGISTVILANGTVLETSKINEAWTHTFEIPYLKNPPQTFYTEYGHYDWIFWIFVLLGLIYASAYSSYRKGRHVHH